jgi:hypothetical protein
MQFEKFQLRGNNSVCAAAFQLLRGRVPSQLRGNIGGKTSTELSHERSSILFGNKFWQSLRHYNAIVCKGTQLVSERP